MTVLDVIRDALVELGTVAAVDTVSPEDSELGLNRFNALLDEWNTDRQTVYRTTFERFTITANLQPHTIGPSGATWTVSQRPESIESANLVLNTSTPPVLMPITLRDAEWWAAQTVPGISTSIPTDLYYDPAWGNGNVYLWPVPTVAYEIELWLRLVLDSDLALTDTFTMPPGYRKALTLTLAEDLAAPMRAQAAPSTVEAARQARARIFANNTTIPSLRTQDAGMPRGNGRGQYFNWLNGKVL